MMSYLYWLTDEQMARLQLYFPKSHGRARVDDWRVSSGIIFVNRNGLKWRVRREIMARQRRSTIAGSGGATKASSSA
jgi:transposase